MVAGTDSSQRFLSLVAELGVVPADELARVQEAQAERPRDVAWLSQQLLKRTELTPKQVAQIQQALRESREGPALPKEERRAEAETLVMAERAEAGSGSGGGIETQLVAAPPRPREATTS